MKKLISVKTLGMISAILFSANSFSQDLDLNQYLYSNNPTLMRLNEKRKAFRTEGAIQSELILSPKLFSKINLNYSKGRSTTPLVTNENATFANAEIGLRKNNLNGSFYEFGYAQSVSDIQGAQYLNTSNFSYTASSDVKTYSGSPFFTFGLPLLAGSSGTFIKNQIDLLNFSEKIEYLSLDLEMMQKESQLKNLVWSYSLNTQLALTMEESLARVRRLYNIVKRKVDQKIEEPGTLFQIDASIKSNEIELMNYKKDIDHAERLLAVEYIQNLSSFSTVLLKDPADAKKEENSPLFSAATLLKITQLELSKTSGQKKWEESNSQLDLILQANLKEENSRLGKSISKSMNTNKPEIVVGLNFTMELDRKLVNDEKAKQKILLSGSERMIADLVTNELKELDVLIIKAANEEKIIGSLEKLKNVQLAKLQNEIRLLGLGRSSLFQVLQFESEYLRSAQAYLGQKLAYQNTLLSIDNYKYKY
jgi:hypothetical protein